MRLLSKNDTPIFELKFFYYNSQRFDTGLLILYDDNLYEIEKILEINTYIYLQCIHYVLLEYDTFFHAYKTTCASREQRKIVKFENSSIKYVYEKKMLGLEQ